MKKLSIAILMLFSISAFSQVTPTGKARSSTTFTEIDSYLNVSKRLGIPTSESDAITAGGTPENSIKLFFNRGIYKLRIYDPVTATYHDVGSSLPRASSSLRGGIKVGPGLTMIGDSLSTVATGPAAIKGEGAFSASTGFGTGNSYSLGTTLTDTLYQVFVQVKAANHGTGSFVLPIKISRTTTSFSVNMMAGSGSPTGLLNWLVLPTGWTGLSGGGGGGSYSLPIASASVLGGIKVGPGLAVNATTGVLSATGGSGVYIWGGIGGSILDQSDLMALLNAKQATLISGTNIKTINGTSILGGGNISVSGGGGTIGYSSGDLVARITNGISWDSGANSFITANPSTRVFNYNSGTSSFGGHEFYTSSNNLRFKIATNGEITMPTLASGSTTPTPTGTEHILTIDAGGLVGHRTIPSGGGGGTWGSITGTLSSQSDLWSALNGKQSSLSGTGFIKASGSTISYDNTSYLSLAGGALTGALTGTTFTATGGFFDTSDIRLKRIVKKRFDASAINSFTYKWKEGPDKKYHVGYSAQEVKKHMPDAVRKDENGKLSVNYIEVLVQKVQALEDKIKELEARLHE